MKKFIAVDGGGNKTLCILGDESGKILGQKMVGGTNHQISGIDVASTVLCDAIDEVLNNAGVSNSEIANVVIGLAGMDFDSDIALMTAHLKGRLAQLSPLLLNDIWIALVAGGIESYGAVSVCGTGHNTGVLAKDGTRYGISALRFSLGNFGGGNQLAEHALHKAFRSYEKTGEYTALEEHLPKLCNAGSMKELLFKIYESNYTYHLSFGIPHLVDNLAAAGDTVCCNLLKTFGATQGEMTGRLIQQAGLVTEPIPVVMAGSIYTKRETEYITDSFEHALKNYCEKPILQTLSREPVLGAGMLALHKLHPNLDIKTAKSLMAEMEESLCNLQK